LDLLKTADEIIVILLFVLMLPREDDRFSVDHLIAKKKGW